MTLHDAKILLKLLVEYVNRVRVILKTSDKSIEAGVLKESHDLELTKVALLSILDLILPNMKRLEVAKQKFSRTVTATKYNRFKEFVDELKQLTSMEADDLSNSWVPLRCSMLPVLDISLAVERRHLVPAPPGLNPRSTHVADAGHSDDDEVGSQGPENEVTEPTNDLTIEEITEQAQAQISTMKDLERVLNLTGKGHKVDLKNKGVSYFLNSVQSFTEEKFTGEGNLTFQDVWMIFLPIHLAPESQINYQRKVGGLISLLAGRARKSMQNYIGANSRMGYFTVWKEMFKTFGQTQVQGGWLARYLVQNGSKMQSRPDVFIHGIKSALEAHQRNHEQVKPLAAEAWIHIQHGMRKVFDEFCRSIPNFWETYRTQSNFLAKDPISALDRFHQFVLYQVENENSTMNSVGTFRILRGISEPKKRRHKEIESETEDETESSDDEPEKLKKFKRKILKINRAAAKAKKGSKSSSSDSSDDEEQKKKKKSKEKKEKEDKQKEKRSPSPTEKTLASGKTIYSRKKPENQRGKPFTQYAVVRPCIFKCDDNHSMFNCTLTYLERMAAFNKNHNCTNCGSPTHRKSECKSRRGCMHCTQQGIPDHKCRHYTGICVHLFDVTGKWKAKPTDFPRDKDYTLKSFGNKPAQKKPAAAPVTNYSAVPPPADYTKKSAKRAIKSDDSDSEPETKKPKKSRKKRPASDDSDSEYEQKRSKKRKTKTKDDTSDSEKEQKKSKKKKKSKSDDSDSEPEPKKAKRDEKPTEASGTEAKPQKS
jgi:hypothetical protein